MVPWNRWATMSARGMSARGINLRGMSALGQRLVHAGSLIVLLLWMAGCGSSMALRQGKVYHPTTSDAWDLTIERFAPSPGAPKKRLPVVLVHGYLMNRYFYKVNGNESLLAMLQGQGYDVWLLDLRGRADAGAPGYVFGKHTYDYSMDEYIRHDMDAALAFVLEKTKAPQVHWVGHSMGGMVAYARLGTLGEPRIADLVTIGSPAVSPFPGRTLLRSYKLADGMALLTALPIAPFTELQASMPVTFIPGDIRGLLWAEENVDPKVRDSLYQLAFNNGSKRETRQFLDGLRQHDFRSSDGQISYAHNMKNITVPVLMILGRRDNLGSPETVRYAYDHLGSTDKDLYVAERSRGCHDDYGHLDLVVGRHAHEDVHPHILSWLNAHDRSP